LLTVAKTAEEAGFEYILIPVSPECTEAWMTAAFIASRTKRMRPLVAMKPGYIHPVALAKMLATFETFSGGRICLNLIAGISQTEAVSEGQSSSKEERYERMDEEMTLVKRLLTEEKVEFSGRFHSVHAPLINPKISGMPPLYLGGGSEQALEISAKHSSVHLFWGDYPSRIAEQVLEMRARAARHDRKGELEFGMRLMIICRETEEQAWDAAHALVEGAKKSNLNAGRVIDSVAASRQKELAKAAEHKLTPHLWTGLSEVRQGGATAVVGNPRQVAAQLGEFIEAGCSSFCLGGYPHHIEAERFGRLVMPLMPKRVIRHHEQV